MPKEFVTQGHQFVGTSEASNAKGKKAVTAVSAELLPANGNRVGVWISNPSAKEVWLAFGPTATKEEGIWIKKETGPVFLTGYNGVISCVTTAEEGSITFVEV